MNSVALQQAKWKKKKKSSELWINDKLVLTIEWGNKKTRIYYGKREWEIKKEGFWQPQLIIEEKGRIKLRQKNTGFWGSENQITIENRAYKAQTKTGTLYNVQYLDVNNTELISYHLKAYKLEPVISFSVQSYPDAHEDLLLLFVLGYYTMRNVMLEIGATHVLFSGA